MKWALVVSMLALSTTANANTLRVAFADGAHVDAPIHARVPFSISVPKEIHRVAVGSQSYRVFKSLQSVDVEVPPQPVKAVLAIQLVTGQRVTVMFRRALSIDAAVSQVVFVESSEGAESSGSTENVENAENAVVRPSAINNARWSLAVVTAIGQSRVEIEGVRTNIAVTTIAACGARRLARRFYAGVCLDQMLPLRPVMEPGECEVEIYCWARRTRNAYATALTSMIGIRYGGRWVADAQLQGGMLVHYATGGSLREHQGDEMTPFRTRTDSDNYASVSPTARLRVGAAYKVFRRSYAGVGAQVLTNAPISAPRYQSIDIYLSLVADL